jgi:O-acetyl-ADP-ribose deacetylase (regulator of RNase III)
VRSQMEVELRRGNITEQADLDAIVHPTTDRLTLQGEIGGAILRRGGEQIDRDAQAKGPVLVGEAIVTGAGPLPNLYVIHAAILGTQPEALATRDEEQREVFTVKTDRRPERHAPPPLTSADAVRATVLNALRIADQLMLTSVGFPPLGVELAHFPLEPCARIMLESIQEYARVHPDSNLRRVVIVVADDEQYRLFEAKMVWRLAS